ncbi:hypothetical protein [Halobellus sp. GM3]|uniref:hypothetical protein n=1 Tax=Halobellus sp. GM3 TaxID=3458410 RepID=UPI00403DAE0F
MTDGNATARYADEITQHGDRRVWGGSIRDVVSDESRRALDVGTDAGVLVGRTPVEDTTSSTVSSPEQYSIVTGRKPE